MLYFLEGFFWGIAYVAPIGMQNLFVINTALQSDRVKIIIAVLAVVFFDIALALACFYGAGSLLVKYQTLQLLILLIGSLLIFLMGINLWRTKPEISKLEVEKGCWQIIIMAGAVTWLNPQALLDGTVLLSAFKSMLPDKFVTSFISGVCSASVFWFFSLSCFTYLSKRYFSLKILNIINKICSVILLFYACRLAIKFLAFSTKSFFVS